MYSIGVIMECKNAKIYKIGEKVIIKVCAITNEICRYDDPDVPVGKCGKEGNIRRD